LKVMAEEVRTTTPKGLWLLVVAPPIIGAIAMQANYVLVRQACSAQRNVALYVVTIAGIVLIAATALLALAVWRVEGSKWPGERVDLPARVRFIGVLGIMSSAMSLLVLVAQGIATLQFDPCQG
jgi:hypothetical protein